MLIRAIAPTDRTQWEPLWQAYLAFYKTSVRPDVTDTTWARFFNGLEPMHAFVAVDGNELVGFVHYIYHRNTWMIEPVCYLQDLFSRDDQRGKGVGRALIEAVYAKAKAEGAGRVYWLTHETNTQAQALYDKVADKPGFIQYRKAL